MNKDKPHYSITPPPSPGSFSLSLIAGKCSTTNIEKDSGMLYNQRAAASISPPLRPKSPAPPFLKPEYPPLVHTHTDGTQRMISNWTPHTFSNPRNHSGGLVDTLWQAATIPLTHLYSLILSLCESYIENNMSNTLSANTQRALSQPQYMGCGNPPKNQVTSENSASQRTSTNRKTQKAQGTKIDKRICSLYKEQLPDFNDALIGLFSTDNHKDATHYIKDLLSYTNAIDGNSNYMFSYTGVIISRLLNTIKISLITPEIREAVEGDSEMRLSIYQLLLSIILYYKNYINLLILSDVIDLLTECASTEEEKQARATVNQIIKQASLLPGFPKKGDDLKGEYEITEKDLLETIQTLLGNQRLTPKHIIQLGEKIDHMLCYPYCQKECVLEKVIPLLKGILNEEKELLHQLNTLRILTTILQETDHLDDQPEEFLHTEILPMLRLGYTITVQNKIQGTEISLLKSFRRLFELGLTLAEAELDRLSEFLRNKGKCSTSFIETGVRIILAPLLENTFGSYSKKQKMHALKIAQIITQELTKERNFSQAFIQELTAIQERE